MKVLSIVQLHSTKLFIISAYGGGGGNTNCVIAHHCNHHLLNNSIMVDMHSIALINAKKASINWVREASHTKLYLYHKMQF